MSDSLSNLDLVIQSQASKEITINAALDAASPATLYGRRQSTTSGLTFGYYGGRYNSAPIANGELLMTASTTSYVVALKTTGMVSVTTETSDWDNQNAYIRLYLIVTGATTITHYEDHRQVINVILGGLPGQHLTGAGSDVPPQWAYPNWPQRRQAVDYTLMDADAGHHLLHPSDDTAARTFTLPANTSVAFAIGTEIPFINQHGAGKLTIAITDDVMRLVGTDETGSRTLAPNGIATAIKITDTEWIISGTGLT